MKNFFKKLFNISDDEIEVVAEEQAAEPEAVAEEQAAEPEEATQEEADEASEAKVNWGENDE